MQDDIESLAKNLVGLNGRKTVIKNDSIAKDFDHINKQQFKQSTDVNDSEQLHQCLKMLQSDQ